MPDDKTKGAAEPCVRCRPAAPMPSLVFQSLIIFLILIILVDSVVIVEHIFGSFISDHPE